MSAACEGGREPVADGEKEMTGFMQIMSLTRGKEKIKESLLSRAGFYNRGHSIIAKAPLDGVTLSDTRGGGNKRGKKGGENVKLERKKRANCETSFRKRRNRRLGHI